MNRTLAPAMTKDAWLKAAKEIVESAYAVDPVHADEVVEIVTGGRVFAWSSLTCRQVRALHRGLFATARLSA